MKPWQHFYDISKPSSLTHYYYCYYQCFVEITFNLMLAHSDFVLFWWIISLFFLCVFFFLLLIPSLCLLISCWVCWCLCLFVCGLFSIHYAFVFVWLVLIADIWPRNSGFVISYGLKLCESLICFWIFCVVGFGLSFVLNVICTFILLF